MKRFKLIRHIDDSGVSGTGEVAEGVCFKNGECALHWLTKFDSIAIYHSIQQLEEVHGHGGHSIIEWEDWDD